MTTGFATQKRSKKTSSSAAALLPTRSSTNAGSSAGMPLFLKRELSIVQAKLAVNQPNDAYEQEADQVADQVMRRAEPNAMVQRKCATCEQEDQQRVQTKPVTASESLTVQRQTSAEPQGLFDRGCFRSNFSGAYETKIDLAFNRIGWRLIHPGACTQCEGKVYIDCCEPGDRECESSSSESTAQRKPDIQAKPLTTAAPASSATAMGQSDTISTGSGAEQRLASQRGNGSPLASSIQTFMETQMGYDFSGVRIHTDQDAAQLSREFGAQAFTHGQDVYFAPGKYNPHSTTGTHLLAHELTHVVQQTGHIQTKPLSDRSPNPASGPLQIQRKCAACEEEEQHIQRSPDDLLNWKWKDWVFKPTPKTSTDDRYDTPENRRRTELKEADQRSNDPTPPKWWESKKPDDPKPPVGCPPRRWNRFWNTCCGEGKYQDPKGWGCISDPENPVQPQPQPQPQLTPNTRDWGDWNLPDPNQQNA
jgi:hypothetical protein